jgi:hypothetical protein
VNKKKLVVAVCLANVNQGQHHKDEGLQQNYQNMENRPG